MYPPNKNWFQNVVGWTLLLSAFAYFFFIIFTHKALFLSSFSPDRAEKIYQSSQWNESQNISEDKVLDEWAIANGYTGWKNYADVTVVVSRVESQKYKVMQEIRNKGVSDSFLYTYVGYKYATGTSPHLLNPEHPPLAKYLIGLSIRYFHNEHIVLAVIGLLTLVVVGLITFAISHSILGMGIAMFLTASSSLFVDQIVHGPQLELFQAFFFLCMFLFFSLKSRSHQKVFLSIVSGIFYGCMLATKTVLPFLILTTVWLVCVGRKHWGHVVIVWCTGIIVFIASYFMFFLQGGSLRGFFGVQKYIIVFYQNAHIPPFEFIGNYLRLIFTGRWKFWDEMRTLSPYSEWNITWPLIFILGLWAGIKKRKQYSSLVLFLILYNGFLLVTPMFPRYLLLLYIPMIILICV